jgi:Zn-dependent protease
LTDLILSLVAAVLAITLHETAHGYAALALGDDTARRMGRLSLNPLRHVDRVGTILLPALLLLMQLATIGRVSFMFGWAKPVPVSAWRFRNPRRGMAVVAIAGPGANFVLAWLAAVAAWGTDYLPPNLGDLGDRFLEYFIMTNLVLGLFNLLPIPPLDGGRIVVGVLPERAAMAWAQLERAGIVVVLVLVFLLPMLAREFGMRFDPLGSALNTLLPAAMGLVLRLAGHNV